MRNTISRIAAKEAKRERRKKRVDFLCVPSVPFTKFLFHAEAQRKQRQRKKKYTSIISSWLSVKTLAFCELKKAIT
jgi:hypothetical protein